MVAVHIQTPLAFSVGLLGNILSFLVTVAPIPTFYKVYKKKSTGSFQSTPYVIALSSALLWLYYAVLTKNILLLTINLITCVLESSYLVVYLFYSTRRDKVSTAKMMSIFDAGLIAFVLLLTLVFLNEDKRTEITGWICASFTVCVFIAPLSIIRFIIITKSVEFMPFWLSFFLTLSAVAWFFYGLLLKDLFVALPNVLGFLFGLAQITLYAIYRNANNADPEQGASGRVAEAGDAGDSKIDIEMAEEVVIKESDAAEIVVTVEIKREA